MSIFCCNEASTHASWKEHKVVPKGSVVLTSSGDMATTSGITAVLHACTGTMSPYALVDGEPTLDSVGTSVANAVTLASEHKLAQLRIPLIGGDIFLQRIGVSLDALAKVIVTRALASREASSAVNDLELVFVDVNDECVLAFAAALLEHFHAPPPESAHIHCVRGSILAPNAHTWHDAFGRSAVSSATQHAGGVGIVNAAHIGLYWGGGLSGVIARACGSQREAIGRTLCSIVEDYRLGSSTGLGFDAVRLPRVRAVLGTFFGQALGDAIGLATEFMIKADVVALYDNRPIPFPNFYRNAHNRRWVLGDVTDDTDQSLLAMETIAEEHAAEKNASLGTAPVSQLMTAAVLVPTLEQRFASKLMQWARNGFPELGDTAGMGLGATTARVIGHADFLHDPKAAAYQVWDNAGRTMKPNGALMRTCMLGAAGVSDVKRREWTRRLCTTTHADPLCIATCLVATELVARILRETSTTGRPPRETLESWIAEAVAIAMEETAPEVASIDEFSAELHHICSAVDNIADLQLDEANRIGYTGKCLAAGLFALRSIASDVPTTSFCDVIQAIIREGGDSDTNACVAGALVGCCLGYDALPNKWLDALANRTWIEARVGAFVVAFA